MTRHFSADSATPPSVAWSLVAEPSRWHEWAPHIRGAWGLGSPEVELDKRGAARLLWLVPIPARIAAKSDDRSWTWQVGPVTLDHEVTPRDGGSRITMSISATGPIEKLIASTYGPLVQLLVDRLARVAERDTRA